MYRKNYSDIASQQVVYGYINSGSAKDITKQNSSLTPGDTLYVKGYAVNTSNVDVFVIAELVLTIQQANAGSDPTTVVEKYWYNIENNQLINSYIDGQYTTNTRYLVGASVLQKYDAITPTNYYKELSISYVYDGATHTNAHTILNIELNLHV